jgi:pimeloyl-ACP methyl ester carboxylesterase
MIKISVNGIELAYERHGRGTPLVLIHGYPLDHSIWSPVVPILENNFDIIIPDLRGFGESRSQAKSPTMTNMAEDIAALIESLEIKKTVVVGHSMGGYVALAFARSFPRRLLGLGLVASQAGADAPEKKVGRYQEAEHILSHGVGDVAEDMSFKLTDKPSLQGDLKVLMNRQNPQGMAGALHAMAERQDSMQLLAQLESQVVLVHGLSDKLIPVERARQIKKTLKNGFLTEIEGVGHLPMMEAPQVTADAIEVMK